MRSATGFWYAGNVNYSSPAGNYYQHLSLDVAQASNTGIWNGTLPSSTVITLGNLSSYQNVSSTTYISYAFHSVEGYSKVGSFTGNNDAANNVFIYTGFKPAFLLVKNITTAGQYWTIWDNKRDPYNMSNHILEPNDTRVESNVSNNTSVDLLSNGFRPKNNNNQCGGGPTLFLYYAVASSPFKTSNAR